MEQYTGVRTREKELMAYPAQAEPQPEPRVKKCLGCRYYKTDPNGHMRKCRNEASLNHGKTYPENWTCSKWRQYRPGHSSMALDAREAE